MSVVPLGLQIVLRVAREEQAGTGAEAETRAGSKKGAREWKVLGLVGGDLAPFAGNVNSIRVYSHAAINTKLRPTWPPDRLACR